MWNSEASSAKCIKFPESKDSLLKNGLPNFYTSVSLSDLAKLMGHSIRQDTKIVFLTAHRALNNTWFYFFASKVNTAQSQNLVVILYKSGLYFFPLFWFFSFVSLGKFTSHLIHLFDLCFFCHLNRKNKKTRFFIRSFIFLKIRP